MRNTDHRPTLIVMVKEPLPGRVKTRLGATIGMSTAAWWFRHQTRLLLRNVGNDPRWQTVLSLAPDRAMQTSWNWPMHLARMPQGTGDLGERMARALGKAMPGPTVLIGGDIPGIKRNHIAHAFQALRAHDAVLGPAPDGGFWCIGLSGPLKPRGLFQGVRWSTEHAMADTLASLGDHPVALTDMLADVDMVDDLAPAAIRATPLRIR